MQPSQTDDPPASLQEKRPLGVRVGLPAVVVIVTALTGLIKVFDFDIFWHVKTGEWIWTHRAIPRSDFLSHTAPGPIAYTETLAQLIFYGFEKIGGMGALSIASALAAGALALGTFAVAGRPEPRTIEARAVATVAAMYGTAFRFGPKTEAFSFVCYALALWLVFSPPATKREAWPWLLKVALLGLAWGNLHRGGVLLCATMAIAAIVLGLRREDRTRAVWCGVGAGVAAMALLLNSGGFKYFVTAFDVASRDSFRAHLPEFRPIDMPFLTQIDPWAFVVGLAWIAATVKRRRFDCETALGLFSVALPFLAVRYVPLAMIAMVPGVARGIDEVGAWLARKETVRPVLRHLMAFTVVIGSFGLKQLAYEGPEIAGIGLLDYRIPVGAANFLQAHPPPGNMWNSFNFGGYLAYRLAPAQRVFIDGRNDTVYPEHFFRETTAAADDPTILSRQIETWKIDYAVLHCAKFEETRFGAFFVNPAFAVVYFDDLSTILVRRSPASEALIREFEYQALRPTNALQLARSFAQLPEADRVVVQREAERAVREAPKSIRAALVLGHILQHRQDEPAAIEQYRRAKELAAQRGLTIRTPID